MELQTQPAIYTSNSNDNFFRKRHTVTVSFAIGILLFLMPFAQLKCASTTLAENSGLGIAIGSEWKVAMVGGMSDLMKKADSEVKDNKKNPLRGNGPNIFAIVSLVAAAVGLLFGLSSQKFRSMIGLSAGILAAIMLIAVLIQYKMLMSSALKDGGKSAGDINMNGLIKVQFTLWFFISLFSFTAAAFFSFKHHKIEMEDEIARTVDFEFQLNKPPV